MPCFRFEEEERRPSEPLHLETGLIASFVVAALIAAASPAPTATPVPLREIARVRSGGICGNLVVHANSAIAAALHDDTLVTRAIARLRAINLDNAFSRRDGLGDLARLANELGDQAARGGGEVKRLREQAERSSDSSHKADVRVFADGLSDALGRQHKIAVDLGDFLRYLDYRDLHDVPDLISRDRLDPFLSTKGSPTPAPTLAPTPPPVTGSPYQNAGSPSAMALAAANDFEARTADVRRDEARAAEHSEAAVSGCS
jgi:hypothetical protein